MVMSFQMNRIWGTMISVGISRTVGYYVVGPILGLILAPIVFGGFWKGKDYTNTYIEHFEVINIVIQYDQPYRGFRFGEKNFHIEHYRDNRSDYSLHSYIYYIERHKKYFELICFEGLEMYKSVDGNTYDLGKLRNRETNGDMILPIQNRNPMTISVYANRLQWEDPTYGTKINPMPVFMNRIVSGDVMEEENRKAQHFNKQWANRSIVPQQIIPPDVRTVLLNDISREHLQLYVKQYLGHVLPKEEFKRLFDS